jgi:hypothetical protein
MRIVHGLNEPAAPVSTPRGAEAAHEDARAASEAAWASLSVEEERSRTAANAAKGAGSGKQGTSKQGAKGKTSWGLIFATVGVTGAVGGWLGLPHYLNRSVVSAAAARGVTLAVDSIDLGFTDFTLRGARASADKIPGMTLDAEAITIELSGINVAKVKISRGKLNIVGSVDTVATSIQTFKAFADYRATSSGAQEISATDLQIKWTGALGPKTVVSGTGMQFTLPQSSGASLLAAENFIAPAFRVESGGTSYGPYRFESKTAPDESTTIRIGFDSTGALSAHATLLLSPGGARTANVYIARSPIGGLGAIGGFDVLPQRTTAELQAKIVQKSGAVGAHTIDIGLDIPLESAPSGEAGSTHISSTSETATHVPLATYVHDGVHSPVDFKIVWDEAGLRVSSTAPKGLMALRFDSSDLSAFVWCNKAKGGCVMPPPVAPATFGMGASKPTTDPTGSATSGAKKP